MHRFARVRALVAAAPALLLTATEAHALHCLADVLGSPLGTPPYVCGDTNAQASAPGSVGVPTTSAGRTFVNASGGAVDVSITAAGGIGGTANAQGDFGHLTAFAQGFLGDWSAPSGPTATAFANAEVSFSDTGVITSSTLAVGTPVDLTAILSVDGAFGATGGVGVWAFHLSGPGFVISRGPGIINFATPSVYIEFPIAPKVGDQLLLKLGIRAAAGADGGGAAPTSGFADLTSTGEVFLRFDTPGVGFQAASGHSYAVPEPVPGLLLAAAFAGFVARRRSRAAAA